MEKAQPGLPVIMGRTITRKEIVDLLREAYREMVLYHQQWDHELVSYPDMEIILAHIDEHGLPPK